MFRKLAALAAVLSLAACASVPNPLTSEVRDGLFVKDAAVNWTVDESKRTPNEAYVAGKQEFVTKLEQAVEEQFRNSPSGAEPVRFEIDVKTYNRVGAAMGNLIGGSNAAIADVKVIRESDGQVLGVYENVMGMHASNAGIIGAVAQAMTKPDIEGIMANSFAVNLRNRFDAKK